MPEAVIVEAVRTPIGKRGGALAGVHPVDLAARVLEALAARTGGAVSNVRGRGLMCAFDLPSEEARDRYREGLFERGVLMLGCGERSVRFRPALSIDRAALAEAVSVASEALSVAV